MRYRSYLPFSLPLSITMTVAMALWLSAVATVRAEEGKTFVIEGQPGQTLDVLYGGKIVGRYMYAYDASTFDKREDTYKTYLHVFDTEGKLPITKGPRF